MTGQSHPFSFLSSSDQSPICGRRNIHLYSNSCVQTQKERSFEWYLTPSSILYTQKNERQTLFYFGILSYIQMTAFIISCYPSSSALRTRRHSSPGVIQKNSNQINTVIWLLPHTQNTRHLIRKKALYYCPARRRTFSMIALDRRLLHYILIKKNERMKE